MWRFIVIESSCQYYRTTWLARLIKFVKFVLVCISIKNWDVYTVLWVCVWPMRRKKSPCSDLSSCDRKFDFSAIVGQHNNTASAATVATADDNNNSCDADDDKDDRLNFNMPKKSLPLTFQPGSAFFKVCEMMNLNFDVHWQRINKIGEWARESCLLACIVVDRFDAHCYLHIYCFRSHV